MSDDVEDAMGGWATPRKKARPIDCKNPLTRDIRPVNERDYEVADLKTSTDLSDEQIAEKVGLPDVAAVDHAMRLPQIRGYLSKELDDAGATLRSAAEVIAAAQGANKKVVVSYKGDANIVDAGEDHVVRLAAAELNLKARGEFREAQSNVNLFLGLTDEQVAAVAAGQLDPAGLIDVGPRMSNPAAPAE